jgi:hypothetical protein
MLVGVWRAQRESYAYCPRTTFLICCVGIEGRVRGHAAFSWLRRTPGSNPLAIARVKGSESPTWVGGLGPIAGCESDA